MAVMLVVGLMASVDVANAATEAAPAGFVFVKGGTFKNIKSNYYGKDVTVSDFYIGRYDVTQKEWVEVMGRNPSKFKGDDRPVEMVSWYDSIEYCNRRSIKEGLQPYYNIDKGRKDPNNKPDPTFGELDNVKWTVTLNPGANGYRLPKLGLYDMSGNVREWCWDWHGDVPTKAADPQGSSSGFGRVWKGGSWMAADFCAMPAFRGNLAANGTGPDQGLRVCRGK
jgi:formylglycine-generating enzyme required for sulfatase activity